jgi:hypothetical protein
MRGVWRSVSHKSSLYYIENMSVKVCFMYHKRSGPGLHRGAKTRVIKLGRGVRFCFMEHTSRLGLSATSNGINIIKSEQ